MTNRSPLQTKVVTPVQSAEFPHQVRNVSTSPGQEYVVAYSSEVPEVSLVSENGTQREIKLAKSTRNFCMSVDSTGRLLVYAYSEDSRLRVRHLDSDREEIVPHRSIVVDARFDERGRLWTVRRETERFVVELRAGGDWEMIADAEVGDSYFALGGAELRPGPAENEMFVSAYSGQSEQENYLCEVDNDILVASHFAAMDGEQFVFAVPGNRTVVTLDHVNCEVCCFRHPFDSSPARLQWPDYAECEDERPGYYGCFVDDGYFLAGSSDGRLFLIQLTPFQILNEIHIAGHAPVPADVKYPSLSGTCGFASDLLAFGRCGDSVAAIFAKDHRSPRPQLVIVRMCALVG